MTTPRMLERSTVIPFAAMRQFRCTKEQAYKILLSLKELRSQSVEFQHIVQQQHSLAGNDNASS